MKWVLINIYYQKTERKKIIDVTDIEKMVAKIARVPERNVSASDREVVEEFSRVI